MTKEPTLFVTELFGDVPLKGRCSVCTEVTFDISARVGRKEDHEHRLSKMFQQHLELRHGPEAAGPKREREEFERITSELPGLLAEQAAVLNGGKFSHLSADALDAYQGRARKILELQTWLSDLVRTARRRVQ